MRTTRSDASGFSLLELMTVLAVFGLLLAISVPAISGNIRTARLDGAVNTLATDLRHARALSSAERRTYAMQFGPSSYSLVRVSPAEVVSTRELPRGVTCAASDTATFYPWGLTESVTVTFSDGSRADVLRLSANGSVSRD